MISAFTNLRNVVDGKYPFVEAILSALPVCDQYVISDGYSTDGTWEILKKLADSHPKIELVRVKWESVEGNERGQILAQTANETRKHCRGKHLLYIQANEVIHEDSVGRLRGLPDNRPQDTVFHIPYYVLYGPSLVFLEEFRIRFVKNIDNITVTGDGMHMNYGRGDVFNGVLNALRHPLNFESNLKFVMTPYGHDNQPFAHVILPKPVFRYSAMSRKDLLAKASVRRKLNAYGDEEESLDSLAEYLQKSTNDRNFSRKMYERTRKNPPAFSSAFLFKPYEVPIKEHPKIMQELLLHPERGYRIREELLK